ncbi:MAG TPA: hypothetical protein VFC00_20040 [Micromonosporaceae bacterium]|nr:hypothetical protein [Micromonosporaceae bacterium]
MRKVSCPYCYHKVDGHRLWYQCAGRGSPGKKQCEAEKDADRARETGFSEGVRPSFGIQTRSPFWPARATCPRCGGETGIRVCPRCHTPVSANFGATRSPLIAMVGAKGTGKTVYLNVLARELLHGLRRRFDADVRLSGTGQRAAVTEKLAIDNVFADLRLMAHTATALNGRRPPAVFEWRREQPRIAGIRRGYRTTFLSFYDTAGEDLTSQDQTHDLVYLGAADALILLLDPFMIPRAHSLLRLPQEAVRSEESTVDVVNRVTEKLRASHGIRSRRRIKIPVAVVFAKIDAYFDVLGADHPLVRPAPANGAYDEAAGQATHEQVRALLYDWGADDIDAHLRYNYAKFRYFAVSSLGAPPDYATGDVDRGGVRPFRVDEPLLWLLSGFKVVPSRGRP